MSYFPRLAQLREELNNRQVGHAIRAVNLGTHTPEHVKTLRKTKEFLANNKSHAWNKSTVLHKAINSIKGLADGVITRDNLIEALIEAINPRQLKMGIAVEREHGDHDRTTDLFKQKDSKNTKQFAKIAKAHLKEIPDYYTRLAKMEKEGKRAMNR
jgi:hypothetical protein